MGLKTKLAMAMVTSAAGAAMMAGGSFALFTSSATNSNNTFTAGTLVVDDVTGGTLSSQEVNAGNLAPGDTKVLTMKVKNDGSLTEWVRIDQSATAATESGSLFGGSNPMTLTLDGTYYKIAPGATATFNVTYNLPLAADNSYQSATGSFSVVVDAVQARNNTNSAGTGPNAWS